MVNRFELEGARDALRVTLFNVERGGEPEIGLNVGAPAVEVIELLLVFLSPGEVAIEADDVAVAGLNPDTAEEAAEVLLARDWCYVEDGSGGVAKKVVANVAEVIVLPVEVVGVHQQHLDKAGFVEGEVQASAEAADSGQGMLEESHLVAAAALRGLLVDRVGLVIDDALEIDAAEEVLVGLGHLTKERVGLHVLDVSLNQGRPFLDGLDDHLLANDRLVDERVLRRRRFTRSREIIGLLLLSMQQGCMGGESCCDEECQGETGGGLFPENHVVLLRLTRGSA